MERTRPIEVVRNGHPGRPGLDTAIARALLLRASQGLVAETFRLHMPARVVAFGRQDVAAAGYERAVAAAHRRGFIGVERLAGGRAAVFHPGTLAFSWTIPDPSPRRGITARFELISGLMVRAFARLGAAADVGEIPGEYCPGRYSVNVGGARKVMGVGQRLARSAAHIGGVVVVRDSASVRNVLVPVYRELGLEWLPSTAGALEDDLPGVTTEAAADAILAELAEVGDPVESSLDAETLRLGRTLTAEHLSPRPTGTGVAGAVPLSPPARGR